jgi:hypothetical protein
MSENPSAFPNAYDDRECPHCDGPVRGGATGMTLRDWFAGQALSALAGMQIGHGLSSEEIARVVSEGAFMLADAMLTERNRTNG